MAMKGFIKWFFRSLLYAGASILGVMLLWRLLLYTGEAIQHPSEMRYLATPLEIMVICYVALWGLRRRGVILGKSFTMVSAALKASVVFYAVGLVTILMGYARFCSLVGFIGAAAYSLKGNLVAGNLVLPRIHRFSPAVVIPVPGLGTINELSMGLCTPSEGDIVTSFNVHLGSEARSWIAFSQRRPSIRMGSFRLHAENVAHMLGSRMRSAEAMEVDFDIEDHIAERFSKGYLLDPSKSIAETLKAISGIGRRGVMVDAQFTWANFKEGISARHLLVASSNDAQAYSRFESDLIRTVPLVGFLDAHKAIALSKEIKEGGLFQTVGETYLRGSLPLGMAYEPTCLFDKVVMRGYVERDGRGTKSLAFPFPEGHLLLVGGKSSGKTRFAQDLASSLAEMNAVVVIIDPNEEYGIRRQGSGGGNLNPFSPPYGVDVLTHAGSLLVFSPTLASAFGVSEPQEEVAKVIHADRPSLQGYLEGMAGKVDEETVRIRTAITQLVKETGIDELIGETALPEPPQNVIPVHVPLRNKKASTFMAELLVAWAASLSTSKRATKVVVIVEDADELLNADDRERALTCAKDYGLSLVLIARSCTSLIQSGSLFSAIAGFRMSKPEDVEAFLKLIGVGDDEPEGIQARAILSGLHNDESLLFFQGGFDFLVTKALDARRGEVAIA